MSYKKSFLYIILSFFCIAIFWIIGYYLLSGIESGASKYVNDRLKIHHRIADNIKQNKILVIGGSSVLFGVDNKYMSERLNMPVINMGSVGGLGLNYLLYDAKKSIKENDVVLLQLEYLLYDESWDIQRHQISTVWDNYNIDYLKSLNFYDKIKLIYGVDKYLIKNKIYTIIMGLKIIDQGIEDSKWIDEYGMIQSNTVENSDRKKLLKSIEKRVFNNGEVLGEYKKENIKDFLSYCRSKNVKVYVTFPPYLYNKKYFDEEDERKIQKIKDFWESKNIKVINDYTDTLYNVDDFCNSVYHLNTNGREKYTKMLIEKLKLYINNN